jgi:L-ascorbate metabolism protein UlaG (beta-lactamase superfamily)
MDGGRFLTDPVLRGRVLLLRRAVPVDPAVFGLLEPLDAVLVSHLHFDHFDPPTLSRLKSSAAVIVPAGRAARLLRRRGHAGVMEAVEGFSARLAGVRVKAVHAEHQGSRGTPWLRGPALGYVLSGSASVYFAGDTDLFPGMAELAPRIDVALLPVSGWGRRVGPGHLDPRRAVDALGLLRPRVAVPIHWGTFAPVAGGGLRAKPTSPAERFRELAAALAPGVEVRVLQPGESTSVLPSTD